VRTVLTITLLLTASSVAARGSVIFAGGAWAAIDRGAQCEALTRSQRVATKDKVQAVAGFSFTTGRLHWGEFHARLSRMPRGDASVMLQIGDQPFLLATRGGGTFVAMMMVSRLMNWFEARTLIATGLSLIAITLYDMTGWTADVPVQTIVLNSIAQGFGLGLVFVPLSTAAFMTLPNHLRTDGTSMLTLVRNVASSIGISIVIAQLTRGTTRVHAVLSEHINPFNNALQMPNVTSSINLNTDMGRAMMDLIVSAQAQIIAFSQDFELVALVTICAIPLVLILKSTKEAMRAPSDHAAVME